MASDNTEVLAAISGLKEHLASTDAKVAVILSQTSAIQSQLSDVVSNLNQAILQSQNTSDSIEVNEIIAVSEQIASLKSDVDQILNIVQNIPTQSESQGLA